MYNNQSLSKLISIEGIDGSGKSSLAQALFEYLSAKYFSKESRNKVILTREPGGSILGKYLRELLQNKPFDICSKAELLLFLADRAQHFKEKVIPALDAGSIVISDRLADSALAYQGYGRGLDKDFINLANSWAMNNYKPDITFYIKIDHKTALERLKKRGQGLTSFENEKSDFFKKVIEGFDAIFDNNNLITNVITIDGLQTQDQVASEAIDYLNKLI